MGEVISVFKNLLEKGGEKNMEKDNSGIVAGLWFVVAILSVAFIGFLFWFFPTYTVWSREMNGRAELAEAEWSKKVAVETAKAKRDSASLEAEAEIVKSKGLAEANRIIGDSLEGKEEYLRYLYITNLAEGENREVIYIPTEAGLPILEATRNAGK